MHDEIDHADATFHLHPNVTCAAEGLMRRRFSVAEIEAMVAAGVMDEDERVELIGGELVPMSSKGNRHEVVKTALLDRWFRARPEDYMLTPETTFRLSDDSFLEPDVVIYERAGGLKGLTGTSVLLVVEIADSSLRYDTGRKADLYAKFGVRELWVIDAMRMTIRTFRSPSSDGYREVQDLSAVETITPKIAPKAFALKLDDLATQ